MHLFIVRSAYLEIHILLDKRLERRSLKYFYVDENQIYQKDI